MLNEMRCLPRWLRGLTLACVSALGLVAIVGSGGGGYADALLCTFTFQHCLGFSATMKSPFITALVGTPVTFIVETHATAAFVSNTVTGPLSFQWRRSSDGGGTYVDIAGATGATYSLASVNLSDDGAVFRVDVRVGNGGGVYTLGHLAVSATPGIVFEDGEFLPAIWFASPAVDPPGTQTVHSEERLATGGNPDAFRRMVYQVTQAEVSASVSLSASVFYTSLSATYDPASQGAIYVIDYSEDCIAFQSPGSTVSNLLIEQGGRKYLSNTTGPCFLPTWSAVAGRSSLSLKDFRQVDGPACVTGESCLDFSASALPMRFGYWRGSYVPPGVSLAYGIDNWKVTVWRR